MNKKNKTDEERLLAKREYDRKRNKTPKRKEQLREKANKFYNENKEKIKQKNKIWNKNNTEKQKHTRYKTRVKKYGITIEIHQKMMFDQNCNCAICGINQRDLKKSLCIDHCHKTNNVRGLLCDKCNGLLGKANDSEYILKKAINYLKKHTT